MQQQVTGQIWIMGHYSEDRASVNGVHTTNWATEVLQSNGL